MPDQHAAEAAARYLAEYAPDFDPKRKDAAEMLISAKAAFLAGWNAGYDLCAEREGN